MIHSRRFRTLIVLWAAIPGLLWLTTSAPAQAAVVSVNANEVQVGRAASLVTTLVHGTGDRSVTLSDTDKKEIANIMRDTGESLDYLTAQRAGNDALDALNAQLEQSSSDTYSGAGFDPKTPGLVWVRFTEKPDDATMSELTALPHDVQVQWGARLSEVAAASLTVQASRLMTAAGARNMVAGPDSNTGVIKLGANFAKEVDLKTLATQIAALVPDAQDPGFVITSLPPEAIPVQFQSGVGGGRSMYGSATNGTCTSGFGISVGSSTGVITADHCPHRMDYNGQLNIIQFVTGSTISYTGANGTGGIDLQWHRAINGNAGQSYFRYDANTDFNVSSGQNVVTGDNPCHYGVGSGYQRCGTISKLNQCESGQKDTGEYVTYCGVAVTSQYVCSDGDSGGPWFNGTVARGVHSAGVPNGTYVGCYFTPQSQFKPALNATLITG